MTIPKKIDKLLTKRYELAMDLFCVEKELDDWILEMGGDLTDKDVEESLVSGIYIYQEPSTAEANVRKYIEERL